MILFARDILITNLHTDLFTFPKKQTNPKHMYEININGLKIVCPERNGVFVNHLMHLKDQG